MSTDKYQRLRDAIAAGPTPGEWDHDFASAMRNGSPAVVEYFVRRDGEDISIAADIVDPESGLPSAVNSAYIAAASPDTIAALLAERDAMREALVIAREYVADEIAYLRAAFRGYERLGKVPDAEADLARIDAALGDANV